MTDHKPWVFMGVDRSHFSAKLRPALRYKQIYHVEYPPDPQQIQQRTGVGFVPILISPDDETLQDTTDIIDALEQRFPQPALMPPHAHDRVLCRLFELYADEFFPTVSMRTRWAYPENEAELRHAFAAFSGEVARGNAVADLMSSYLPMLGVTADTIPVIDAHLDEMLAALCRHFAQHPFVLGERMSMADCTLMGPLYAHLYLDRVTRKQLYDNAIEVCMWIERCNRPVPQQMGDWFGGAYPPTLVDVLTLIGTDVVPLLSALETGFTAWASDNAVAGEEAPRGVAEYSSELRGVPFSAGVRPYVAWKIQRFRDAIGAAPEAEQIKIRADLSALGFGSCLTPPPQECRLQKDAFRLVVAELTTPD